MFDKIPKICLYPDIELNNEFKLLYSEMNKDNWLSNELLNTLSINLNIKNPPKIIPNSRFIAQLCVFVSSKDPNYSKFIYELVQFGQ